MLSNRVLPFIWFFVKKCKYRVLLSYLLFMADGCIFLFVGSYVYKLIANSANNGTLTMAKAILYIIFYAYTLTSYCLTMAINKILERSWQTRIEHDIDITLFINTLRHDIDYFNDNFTGALNNKIQSVIENINIIFFRGYYIVNNNIIFIASIIILYLIDYKLAIFSICWCLLFHLTLIPFLKKYNFSSEENSNEKNEAMGVINDCFMNISNIKIFSSERKEYRTIKKQSSKILRTEIKMINLNSKMDMINYIFTTSYVAILNSMAFINYLNKGMDMGTMLFVLSFSLTICYWINWEIYCIVEAVRCIGVIRDSIGTLMEPIKIKDKKITKKLTNIDGKIVFNNVNFSYNKNKN